MTKLTFAVQDSVQLMHGYTPTMTISQINEETEMALCIWWDTTKTRKMHQDWLPLNVLKHTPKREPLDLDALKRSIGYR